MLRDSVRHALCVSDGVLLRTSVLWAVWMLPLWSALLWAPVPVSHVARMLRMRKLALAVALYSATAIPILGLSASTPIAERQCASCNGSCSGRWQPVRLCTPSGAPFFPASYNSQGQPQERSLEICVCPDRRHFFGRLTTGPDFPLPPQPDTPDPGKKP